LPKEKFTPQCAIATQKKFFARFPSFSKLKPNGKIKGKSKGEISASLLIASSLLTFYCVIILSIDRHWQDTIATMSKRGSTDAPGHKEHLDDEDSDMEGLLVADQKNQMKPFNVDTSDRDRGLRRPTKPSYSILELVFAYCSYTCVYAPRLCLFLGVVALLVPTYFVIIDVFLNPTEHFGVIANDYTDITSRYDLSIGKVDHWCLRGDNDSCRCEDPLQPQARGEFRSWSKAHKSNVALVQGAVESATSIDIAFLGESVVEEMDGRWFGDKTNTLLSELAKIFDKNFSKEKGGKLDGLAIGVAGDTVSLSCTPFLNT
jgi:hypothetical protein